MSDAGTSVYQTPDEYVAVMIERVQALGSRITDFSQGSTARTLLEGYAAAASQHSAVIEQLRLDSYLATAQGDALDRKAADYQVTRKAAVAATGTVTITRGSAGTAVVIPAGWGTLLTRPVSNQQPVAFISTVDAVFSTNDLAVTVPAAAVEGGIDGNITSGTVLLASNPVPGFDTDGGFVVSAAFVGGVDAESDDDLRARVPLEVQGRVKGTVAAFQAGALRVAGVTSASVLQASDTREAGGTVAAGHLELYYKGDPSLLSQVQAQVDDARVAGQSPTAFTATARRLVFSAHVFCLAGVDTTALAQSVSDAVIAVVAAVGVGGTVYASAIAKAIHDLPDVISATLPFGDLRLFTEAVGTSHDVVCGNGSYPTLAGADVTVTVTAL